MRILASLLLLSSVLTAQTKPVTVRLATAMSSGTSYHQVLQQMGQTWRQAPGGGVSLTVVAGGDEADNVRRMRSGELQAGMLGAVGLSEIDKSAAALSYMPMMFRSTGELDYVLKQLRPELEKGLLDKGFVTLFWGDAGWVRCFAKEPVLHPADLKKLKLFALSGDNFQIDLAKSLGFQPVPLETSGILPGLQKGLITAVLTEPFNASATKVNGPAPNMLEVNWAPLVGAAVISSKVWDSIPAATQEVLRKAAEEAGTQMRASRRQEAENSIQTMAKGGLKVQKVTPEVEAEWRSLAESVYPKIRGNMVPAATFDKVQRLLTEYRAAQNSPVTNKPVTVRLATVMPSGTSYHQILQRMGQTWRKAPGGGVGLTIFAGGDMGGEADIVRRMRLGQLQAGMLSVVGLSEIDKQVTALSYMPMMFRSTEELDYIREQLRPELEKGLLDKGFVTLFWGDAGWVRFFAKEPILHPADLKKLKLFAWSGDNFQIDLMKTLGFQPVPLETVDIPSGLRTGLISAISTAPFYALAYQVYGSAPNMLDVNWAPLAGATVITSKVWDSIPAATQAVLRKSAEEAGVQMRARGRQEAEESVQTMAKRGLKVQKATPQIEAEWRSLAESVYPKIRGNMVPAAMFDKVQRLLTEYRAGKGKAAK